MAGWNAAGTKPLTSSSFLVLLGVAERPRHGLGIADEVERRTDGAVEIGPGTLYTALHRMVASGLIEESSQRPDPDDDDPRRRYYRITRSGREALAVETERLQKVLAAVRANDLRPSDATG